MVFGPIVGTIPVENLKISAILLYQFISHSFPQYQVLHDARRKQAKLVAQLVA